MPVYVNTVAAEIDMTPVIPKMYGGLRSELKSGSVASVEEYTRLRFSARQLLKNPVGVEKVTEISG